MTNSRLIALLLLAASCWAADAKGEKLHIACVGDSITYGACVEDRENKSYPKVLEGLLNASGRQVEVINCGTNGATMLTHGNVPYVQQPTYKQAMESSPDVVVIMLGTNDSKPDNWTAHKGEFAGDLVQLIQGFAKLPSKPAVFLVLPPPTYAEGWGITGAVIAKEIVPLIKEVAAKEHLPIIDIFTMMSGHPELFAEGIHPNAAGAERMAKAVATALTSAGRKSAPVPK